MTKYAVVFAVAAKVLEAISVVAGVVDCVASCCHELETVLESFAVAQETDFEEAIDADASVVAAAEPPSRLRCYWG